MPTCQLSWDQPHEGNLFEHLYRQRAFQMAGGRGSAGARSDAARATGERSPGSAVPVLFGRGALAQLGERGAALGGVARAAGERSRHRRRRVTSSGRRRRCGAAGIAVRVFDEAEENPTTVCVDKAVAAAREHRADLLVGLGGGSSMDCAKGCNFILTNGGRMQDYWGVGKATKPMLPLIAVPTTAGTGSEAQSFALITDPDTHQKMACGDKKALPRAGDPRRRPDGDAAAEGRRGDGDRRGRARGRDGRVRRSATTCRMRFRARRGSCSTRRSSRRCAIPTDADAREQMLLGAHLAGAAIENSMLGAAHAVRQPADRRSSASSTAPPSG